MSSILAILLTTLVLLTTSACEEASPAEGRDIIIVDTNPDNPTTLPFCGDNACNGTENTVSCSADCGALCGDGSCSIGIETNASCPADCAGDIPPTETPPIPPVPPQKVVAAGTCAGSVAVGVGGYFIQCTDDSRCTLPGEIVPCFTVDYTVTTGNVAVGSGSTTPGGTYQENVAVAGPYVIKQVTTATDEEIGEKVYNVAVSMSPNEEREGDRQGYPVGH